MLILAENFGDMTPNSTKKRLVTNIHNLTAEQQDELKNLYPKGFSVVMMRIDKPNGDFFYAVPYETADTYYLVKIDVKIDDTADDGADDDYYDGDDEIKGADELSDEAGDMGADDDDDMED